MRFTTDDVIARCNDAETDGLSDVSFGGPNDSFFLMCRDSRECDHNNGILEKGVADIYIEINDQSRATYGGIVECILTKNTFSIVFDEQATRDLQHDRVDVHFNILPNVLNQLRDALNCIFRDTDIFTDRTAIL